MNHCERLIGSIFILALLLLCGIPATAIAHRIFPSPPKGLTECVVSTCVFAILLCLFMTAVVLAAHVLGIDTY